MPIALLRRFLGRRIRPLAVRLLLPLHPWLLRRDANLFGCRFRATPEVFHPGLYFSTKRLAQHLLRMKLDGMSVLDVGTGSGALRILAATRGARVLAVDINPAAVALARANAALNRVAERFEAVESDLFSAVPDGRRFHLIVFNPPFYPRPPRDMPDRAWNAGEDYATLRAFFRDAGRFLAQDGRIVLISSTDMDLALLSRVAQEHRLVPVRETIIPHLFEKFVIREYTS